MQKDQGAARPDRQGGVRRPRPTPLATGPMGFTDILDGAFQLYRSASRPILALGLLVLVPVQLAVAFAQRGTLGNSLSGILQDPDAAEALLAGTDLGATAIGFAVTQGLVLPLLAGGYLAMGFTVANGGTPSLGVARSVIRRFGPSLLGAWWLHLLALAIPIVPAVLFLVTGSASTPLAVLVFPLAAFGTLGLLPLFIVVAPAVVVEGLGPLAALRRSQALVRRRYAATFGTLVGTSFVIGLLATLLSGIPEAGGMAGGFGFAWVLLAIASTIAQLISAPLTAHVALLLFLDARVRLEGHDLISRARSMRGGPTGQVPVNR